MKTIITVIAFLLTFVAPVFAQDTKTFTRQGNTFEQVSSRNAASAATKTQFTWKDTKGNEYPIYVSKNGRCFVNKVSGKTGKEYKQYLKEEISREVCKELGITYVEKNENTSKTSANK